MQAGEMSSLAEQLSSTDNCVGGELAFCEQLPVPATWVLVGPNQFFKTEMKQPAPNCLTQKSTDPQFNALFIDHIPERSGSSFL